MSKIPTELFHYSAKEIKELNYEYFKKWEHNWNPEASMKPTGLWISVEDDLEDIHWKEWCVREEFRIECLQYKYKVKLSKDSDILHLKTEQDIYSFSMEYGTDIFTVSSARTYIHYINWRKVKEKYDGIIISPYQWGCRLLGNCCWYYPWDCASGCLWNLDKFSLSLEEVIDPQELKPQPPPAEESSTDSLLANLAQSL